MIVPKCDTKVTGASYMLCILDIIDIIQAIINYGIEFMPSLVVRNIDNEIVQALKARAGEHGISAEAEHRKILQLVLLKPKRKSFAEALSSMPSGGEDSDFERIDEGPVSNVFD